MAASEPNPGPPAHPMLASPHSTCPVELQAQACKVKRTERHPTAEVRPREEAAGGTDQSMQVVGDLAFCLLPSPEFERKRL